MDYNWYNLFDYWPIYTELPVYQEHFNNMIKNRNAEMNSLCGEGHVLVSVGVALDSIMLRGVSNFCPFTCV